MADHSDYSPSRLHRIIECPGSVRLIKANKIASKSSVYADHGTLLHKYTEEMLTGMIPDFKSLKYKLMDEELYESGDEYLVQDCVTYFSDVLRTKSTHRVRAQYETKVSLESWGIPEIWGTLDACIMDYTTMHLDVFDWKFGRGVQVFAKENPQQMAYAAGAIGWPNTKPVLTVSMHIIQPPLDHYDVYETTTDDLYAWVHGTLAKTIFDSRIDPPVLNPGEEQCRFCEAAKAAKCDARHAMATANAIDIFANAKLKANLTPKQIQAFLEAFPLVEQVAKGYMVYIQQELERGSTDFDKYKLVEGRSNRKWIDEEATIKWLANNSEIDDIFTSKLMSPSQIEKLDKQAKKNINFQKLYEKPPGKIKLAKASDHRPAVNVNMSATEIFKDAVFPDELD